MFVRPSASKVFGRREAIRQDDAHEALIAPRKFAGYSTLGRAEGALDPVYARRVSLSRAAAMRDSAKATVAARTADSFAAGVP